MAAAEKLNPAFVVRRFERPDLDTHGKWVLPRLLAAFPHLHERTAAGWLQSLINSNESLFLFHDHGVALAQVEPGQTLQPEPVIRERFVWVENPKDESQIEAATAFYGMFANWAKHLGARVLIVEEMTDVPHKAIGEALGDKRMFTRQMTFVRL